MKNIRLFVAAFAIIAVGGWAVAHACDKSRGAQASASACSEEMAKNCTPAQAASCSMKGAATQAGNATGCPYVDGKCVKTGAAGPCPSGTSAAKMNGACSAHGVFATTASMTKDACCAAKGATRATAAAAGACSAHGVSATTAVSGSTAGVTAVPAGGPGCSAHASAKSAGGASCGPASASTASHDCDACAEWALCESQIEAAGAGTQVVALKNGVMYVYTADSPARARQVQTALMHRNERLAAITAAGDKSRLCPECKAMRGASASGKLSREVVNIEGGCLTLLTSSDPSVVAKIHALAGVAAPARNART